MLSKSGIEFPDVKKNPTGVERCAVKCIVDELKNGFDVEVVILNDFTHADFIVRIDDNENGWFQIQVKTTTHSSANGWGFHSCNQYPGMVLILVAVLEDLAWITDGSYAATQKQHLRISRGNRCKHKDFIIEAQGYRNIAINLIAAIHKRRHQLSTCSELSARSHLKNPKHAIEFNGIMLWIKHVAEPNGYHFRFPNGQGLSHDGECFKNGQMYRIQFKTATPAEYCGFNVTFWRQGGLVDGKNTTKPYKVGDADLYIVIRAESGHLDVWTFNENTLAGNNPNATFYIASAEGVGGKKSFAVHLPEKMSSKVPAPKNQMIWTRSAHVRYAR